MAAKIKLLIIFLTPYGSHGTKKKLGWCIKCHIWHMTHHTNFLFGPYHQIPSFGVGPVSLSCSFLNPRKQVKNINLKKNTKLLSMPCTIHLIFNKKNLLDFFLITKNDRFGVFQKCVSLKTCLPPLKFWIFQAKKVSFFVPPRTPKCFAVIT